MSLKHLSVDTPAGKVEDVLHDLTDGLTLVIAVEIFDAPSSRWSAKCDADIGPWVLGPEAEVHAWLEEHGHEDFAEQYAEGGYSDIEDDRQ